MSDEPTKYVLKKPMSRSETAWICDKFFDELFVPVSDLSRENQSSVASENLKQQIRDIIQDAYSEAWNHDHISTERTDEFVSWVLELIQGDTK